MNTSCVIVEFELQAQVKTEHIFLFCYYLKCRATRHAGIGPCYIVRDDQLACLLSCCWHLIAACVRFLLVVVVV